MGMYTHIFIKALFTLGKKKTKQNFKNKTDVQKR